MSNICIQKLFVIGD